MNFESVRSIIDTYIKKNGVEAITGDILNNVLNTMLDDVDTAISSIEPSPGGGSGEGGVSEKDVLNILEKNNYITSSALSSYYTKGESDARYLALSGGVMNGTLTINAGPAIKIYRPTGTPYIRFGRSEAQEFGELGVDVNNGNPVWWGLVSGGNAYGSWHPLIHSGNIGSYALTLGGGEISGLILPSAHNNYALGGWNQSFASIYANQFWSGAANNNLWLIGGSYDTIGLVFAQSNNGGNTSILGTWTSKGLCVGGSTPTRTFNVVSPDYTCMAVQRNLPSGYGAVIEFYNTANKLGQIGWDNEYAFRIADTSGKSLISGKYDSLNIGDYFTISNTATNPLIQIVHGGYNWYIQGYQSNYLYIGAGSTKSLRIKYNGEVYCPQNLIVSGDFSFGSDMRFKDKIEDMGISIADIAKAPLFTYKWNDREDDAIYLGSSAQYWEKIAPWLVSGDDFKSLNYATLGVAMGISLAKKTINHEERIKVLEAEIKRLKREQYGN